MAVKCSEAYDRFGAPSFLNEEVSTGVSIFHLYSQSSESSLRVSLP